MMIFRVEKEKIVAFLSRAVVWACLGFVGGVAGASAGEGIWFFVVELIGAVCLTVFFEKSWKQRSAVVFIFALFLYAGAWHMNMRAEQFLAFPSPAYFAENLSGKAEVYGYVSEIRKETDRNAQIRIEADEAFLQNDTGKPFNSVQGRMRGDILAFVPSGTDMSVGDYVAVRGELERPKPIERFNYPQYLAAQGIEAVIFRAEMEHVANPHAESFMRVFFSFIGGIRAHARDIFARQISGTEGEVLIASTLGYPLSQDTQKLFSRAGITHLVAISGMNIALVMGMLSALFLGAGIRRQHAILISLGGIFLFVCLVGFSASVVRAALMGAIVYTGWVVGRPLSLVRLLLYTGTIMLFLNPFLLTGDVGFQLSFAAMAGILLCAPYFDGALRSIGAARKDLDAYTQKSLLQESSLWRMMRGVIALSLAALLFTAPLTLFHFGMFSLGGILLNIVAVPLFPFVIVLAFFMAVLGSIHIALAAPFAWAAWLLLFLLKQGAQIIGSIPFSIISLSPAQLWVLIGGYACVAGFLLWLIRKGYNPLLAATQFLDG